MEEGKLEKGSERWKEKIEEEEGGGGGGYLTPRCSRPTGQLTAISSMR